MKYKSYQLQEVCSFIDYRGKTPPKTSSGIPLITAKIIKNGAILPPQEFIAADFYDEWMRRGIPKKGSIVFTTEAPLGEVAQIKTDGRVAFAQRVIILEPDSNLLYADYLLYALQDQILKERIKARATGTTVVGIKAAELKKVIIDLPPLDIQKRLSKVLSALDAKIELNQRINENLERQAQALFKSWFVDFEPFGGEIPADWEQLSFSEFLTTSTEKSNDPFLPMFSVTDKGIFPRDEKFKKNLSMTNLKSKVVHQTDLVFGMSREILNWGIMRYPIGGVSSAYNIYHVDEQINTFYLESYMKANYQYFKDLIKPASREGQGIDKNALMQKMILIPTKTVLDRYYRIENAITQTAQHRLEENLKLLKLRDTLLPKLMSREIDLREV